MQIELPAYIREMMGGTESEYSKRNERNDLERGQIDRRVSTAVQIQHIKVGQKRDRCNGNELPGGDRQYSKASDSDRIQHS